MMDFTYYPPWLSWVLAVLAVVVIGLAEQWAQNRTWRRIEKELEREDGEA